MRSTAETWVSTVLTEMNSSAATSLYEYPGASIGTVVLGAIVAICSAAIIALLVFGNMLAVPDFWQRFGAFAAIGVGIVLIIGGIVSGIRNRRQK